MAVDIIKRCIPGYGCYEAWYQDSAAHFKDYIKRPESTVSLAIKAKVAKILIRASQNLGFEADLENMLGKLPLSLAKQKGYSHLSEEEKTQEILRLVKMRFKIIDAYTDEKEVFSVAYHAQSRENYEGYSYILGVDPFSSGSKFDQRIYREVAALIFAVHTQHERWRGCASLVSSVAACYFGCPWMGIGLSAPVADVATYVAATCDVEYKAKFLREEQPKVC